MDFTVYRHRFKADLGTEGDAFFYIDEPEFNVIHIAKNDEFGTLQHLEGKHIALLGIAIVDAKQWIEHVIKAEMDEEVRKLKKGGSK